MSSKFVILTAERTGSNYLCSVLDKDTCITCHREMFHPHAIYMSGGGFVVQESGADALAQRNADPIGFLNQFMDSAATGAVGFKLFIYHNPQVLSHLLRDDTTAKILLYRRNLLAQYSSHVIAAQTQRWVNDSGEKREAIKIPWNENEFIDYRNKVYEMFNGASRMLMDAGAAWMSIEYLQLLKPGNIEKLKQFLGITPSMEPEEVPLSKQNTGNILDRFSNPEDVLVFLQRENCMDWQTSG